MKTQTKTTKHHCPSAAMRYARVLYELNISEDVIDQTRDTFREVPQLQKVLVDPTIQKNKKLSIIDQVFPEEIRNFLKVLCENRRMDLLTDLFDAYEEYRDRQKRVLHAVLTCVEPPSEEQLRKMKAFLCKKYEAAEVVIDIEQDDSLIGGFVLRAKDEEYDWSLRGRLTRLEQKLTWR